MRPGIITFLKKLYRNRNRLDVILFTNHCNDTFLPFLRNCLNYLITGKVRVHNNPISFFKDWITREDPRRTTTPEKNIDEILSIVYPFTNRESISVIMFDDTPSKIIADESRHTIVEVPEYDWDPPYEYFAKCWKFLLKESAPDLKELEQLDDDFHYLEEHMPSKNKMKDMIQITYEFFDEPLLHWLTETSAVSDDDSYDTSD